MKQTKEERRQGIREATRRWRLKLSSEEKAGKRRDSYHQQMKGNPSFRLTKRLRGRMEKALKKLTKSARTVELLGCSIDELKAWLSGWFQPGMSWDNYGDWHIDHRRPCSSFDLSNPEQQKRCFHYLNLQPLWAKDNLSKGDTFTI